MASFNVPPIGPKVGYAVTIFHEIHRPLTPNDSEGHLGLAYWIDGKPFYLHLFHHKQVSVNPPKSFWGCVNVDAEGDSGIPIQVIVGFVHALGDRLLEKQEEKSEGGIGIPYSITFDDAVKFDENTHELMLSSNCIGLSCATFVLCALRSAKIRLIQSCNDWPESPGDEEWAKETIGDWLRTGKVPEEHIAAVIQQRPLKRIRPTQILGAAVSDPRPCKAETAVTAAEIIKGHWSAWPLSKILSVAVGNDKKESKQAIGQITAVPLDPSVNAGVLQFLGVCLWHSDPQTRKTAAEALGRRKDRTGEDLLRKRLSVEGLPYVKKAIEQSLAKLIG